MPVPSRQICGVGLGALLVGRRGELNSPSRNVGEFCSIGIASQHYLRSFQSVRTHWTSAHDLRRVSQLRGSGTWVTAVHLVEPDLSPWFFSPRLFLTQTQTRSCSFQERRSLLWSLFLFRDFAFCECSFGNVMPHNGIKRSQRSFVFVSEILNSVPPEFWIKGGMREDTV